MRAGTYIKYVATCLPTALIGIGIFLAIFRAKPAIVSPHTISAAMPL